MQPDQHQDEQWQQPQEAPSQAPFQAPVDEPTAATTEVEEPGINPTPAVEAPQSADEESPEAPVTPESISGPDDDAVLVRWEAPEYAEHDRGTGWYVIFGVATLVVIVAAILLMHSITFAILVPVMAVALFIYTRRPPEVVHYTLSRKGLHINDKLFPYAQFKSFGVLTHGAMHSAVLVPRKRFQLGQTLYFPENVGEKLVDMLASRLPMQEVKLDAIDRLLARLHL